MPPASPPLVTVVVPVFNGEDYLPEALRSIAAQDFARKEVLVVDDGSQHPEAISSIVTTFPELAPTLLRKENGGVASALNLALERARGRAFVWLSHDDVMAPGRLSRQWERFSRRNGRYIAYGDYAVFEANKLIGSVDCAPLFGDRTGLSALASGAVNGCTVMMGVSDARELGGFDAALQCTQDFDLWLRALNRGYRLLHTPGLHVFTRLHPAQTFRASNRFLEENKHLWEDITVMVSRQAFSGVAGPGVVLRLDDTLQRSSYLAPVDLGEARASAAEVKSRLGARATFGRALLALSHARILGKRLKRWKLKLPDFIEGSVA